MEYDVECIVEMKKVYNKAEVGIIYRVIKDLKKVI